MKGLPNKSLTQLRESYRRDFGLSIQEILPNGQTSPPRKADPLEQCAIVVKTRADAIREAVRWGEVYTFYIAPGIISWIAPVVDEERTLGGLMGGEVIAEEDATDLQPAVNYLVEAGCPQKVALHHVKSLPRWSHSKVNQAAGRLFEEIYRTLPLNPILLKRHHEHALQQRQIAENIHKHKGRGKSAYSFDEERALFSLIRIGDKPGARKMLNRMLAGMFLNSPKVVMVQAYAIEMMGYLVRVAIEDSPMLERMLEEHGPWIHRILKADTFETLCWEVREILDEFMNMVFVQGYNRSNRMAQKITDLLASEYRNGLTLKQIGQAVGLSSFRVAHLVKETTGKTVTQHIRLLRIREAQKLLLHTDKTYVEIAYSLGFSDHSYFIRQFRETTGITPAKYRRGSQNKP